MSLNVKQAPMKGGKDIEPLEAATYPVRLVQVIDLGLQPQEYQGEQKAPMRMAAFTYEFLDEFMKDADGQDMKDKPRWLTERFPIHNIKAEKAKSTKRAKALDPTDKANGDFFAMLGFPALATVVLNRGKGKNAGKFFNNIAEISPMRAKDVENAPALVNKPVAFSLDAPDVEVFRKFPEWVQNTITSNLEFSGSKLEALLKDAGENHAPPKQDAKAAEDLEEDRPF